MAWLEQRPNSDHHVLCFRWSGRKFKHTLRGVSTREAEHCRVRVEETLGLIERGRLDIPENVDVLSYVLSDGKKTAPAAATEAESLTLRNLFDRYNEIASNGALEANTLYTMNLHFKHILKSLGSRRVVNDLTLDDIQKHIDRRARGKRGGRPLSAGTLKAEITSFRVCWNWARKSKKIREPFPSDGLMFPKREEKPPFQTWQEIEQRIAVGGLNKIQEKELWKTLFLTKDDVRELLAFAKVQTAPPFLYPMLCFAAHTGCRRSELLRLETHDLDFTAGTALIREKKRAKGLRTTRRVPLSTFLVKTLREWLAVHPGGSALFVQNTEVPHSKTTRSVPSRVTEDEAQDAMRRLFDKGKWKVLRGWHVLRHSFCSNCASCGVDQRLINAWVGHQTEEMVKRYRHLIPHQERIAIAAVFGDEG